MELVEDHGADAFQEGIGLQALDEDPLGHHQDPGLGTRLALEAHLVAHLAAERPAAFLGHPAGGGAGGDPPRLEHDDLLAAADPRGEQGRGNAGRLPRAGGRDEHGRGPLAQRRDQLGQDLVDGERRGHGGGRVHHPPPSGGFRARGPERGPRRRRGGRGSLRARRRGGAASGGRRRRRRGCARGTRSGRRPAPGRRRPPGRWTERMRRARARSSSVGWTSKARARR